MSRNFGMTDDFKKWLELPDDPSACIACGAIAGCCKEYPNCMGSPDWNPESYIRVTGQHFQNNKDEVIEKYS